MAIPARPTFGIGVESELSDPAFYGFSGDVAMRLGNNAVVRPAIGICSGDGETNPYFGAGVGYKLVQSGNMTLNVQSGISYLTFDGGNEMIIPAGVAAAFKGTGNTSFYAGASMWFASVDIDNVGSASDSDPVLFGGVMGNSGSLGWTLGAQVILADDTDFGIIAGLNLNQAASAIRHLGSMFRK